MPTLKKQPHKSTFDSVDLCLAVGALLLLLGLVWKYLAIYNQTIPGGIKY